MLHSNIKATSIPCFVYVKIGAVFREDLKKTMFYLQKLGEIL